jgi:hypothetical protein
MTTTFDVILAIVDPNRWKILKLLSFKRLIINSIAENFEMGRPAVSRI